MQEAESLTEVTDSNWVPTTCVTSGGRAPWLVQLLGQQPKPTQRQQGGYITWVVGRVSAAYCQLVGMFSTWGHRGKGPVLHSGVQYF